MSCRLAWSRGTGARPLPEFQSPRSGATASARPDRRRFALRGSDHVSQGVLILTVHQVSVVAGIGWVGKYANLGWRIRQPKLTEKGRLPLKFVDSFRGFGLSEQIEILLGYWFAGFRGQGRQVLPLRVGDRLVAGLPFIWIADEVVIWITHQVHRLFAPDGSGLSLVDALILPSAGLAGNPRAFQARGGGRRCMAGGGNGFTPETFSLSRKRQRILPPPGLAALTACTPFHPSAWSCSPIF